MAVTRAKQTIMASHVAVIVLDSTEGLVRGDMQVAGLAVNHAKSCVLLANKADLLTQKALEALPAKIHERLPQLWYAPVVTGSALHGTGIDDLMDVVTHVAEWRSTRVPRRRLNELFQRAQLLKPLPKVRAAKSGQAGRLRILYVLQAFTETPTFVFHMNRKGELHPSDMRWLENTIRNRWAFPGTPLRIVLTARDVRKRRRLRDASKKRTFSNR